nr:DUF421 domain-containing protein [Maliibacterium massiliense]
MSISELLIRVFASILVLLVMARLNGPKQISQMNFYDYIVGITVGSLTASVSIDSGISIPNGLIAIALFLLCGMLMSWLAQNNMVLRRFLFGRPIVLIAKGNIQRKGLRRARMNTNELLSTLRYSGYFNVSEVNYAILEPTGKLSVQPKGFARPTKASDLPSHASDTTLYANVIIDGNILHENLKAFGRDALWLRDALQKQGIVQIADIALATLDEQGAFSIYLLDHNQTSHTSLI